MLIAVVTYTLLLYLFLLYCSKEEEIIQNLIVIFNCTFGHIQCYPNVSGKYYKMDKNLGKSLMFAFLSVNQINTGYLMQSIIIKHSILPKTFKTYPKLATNIKHSRKTQNAANFWFGA